MSPRAFAWVDGEHDVLEDCDVLTFGIRKDDVIERDRAGNGWMKSTTSFRRGAICEFEQFVQGVGSLDQFSDALGC